MRYSSQFSYVKLKKRSRSKQKNQGQPQHQHPCIIDTSLNCELQVFRIFCDSPSSQIYIISSDFYFQSNEENRRCNALHPHDDFMHRCAHSTDSEVLNTHTYMCVYIYIYIHKYTHLYKCYTYLHIHIYIMYMYHKFNRTLSHAHAHI